MVFVTVGYATQGFRRLLDPIDGLAGHGVLRHERVFIQSGHNTDFRPRYCDVKSFLSMDEFRQCMEKADLIICHGGCTQLEAVRLDKVPVVIPRRKQYGEHVNDHQMQLVQVLASEGCIIPAYEPEELTEAILEARRRNARPLPRYHSDMLALVEKAIEELTS